VNGGHQPGILVESRHIAAGGIDVADRRTGAETDGKEIGGVAGDVRLGGLPAETGGEESLGIGIVYQENGPSREGRFGRVDKGLPHTVGHVLAAGGAEADLGHAVGDFLDDRPGKAAADRLHFRRQRPEVPGHGGHGLFGEEGVAVRLAVRPGFLAMFPGKGITARAVQADQRGGSLELADIDGQDGVPGGRGGRGSGGRRLGEEPGQPGSLGLVRVEDQLLAVAFFVQRQNEIRGQIRENCSLVEKEIGYALEELLGQGRVLADEAHPSGSPYAQLVVEQRRQIQGRHVQGVGVETPRQTNGFPQGRCILPVEPEFHQRAGVGFPRREGLVPANQVG